MIKLATEPLASCAGCHMSLLDLHEDLLELLNKVEIVYSPILMDVKEPPEDIDIAIIGGAIRNKENMERVKKLRQRAKTVIAFGTCACYGGVSGLSILHSRDEILNGVYTNRQGTTTNVIPNQDIPDLLYRGYAVGDVIKVDYYITGCPPKEFFLRQILLPLIEGRIPDLQKKSVCSECDREMVLVKDWKIKRRYEGVPEEKTCLLGQGYICLGSVTFGRCHALCTHHGIPCHGCGGPSLDVLREPCRDIYNTLVMRIQHLTELPQQEIEKELYDIPHTVYPFVMGSKIMENKSVSKIPDIIKERHL
ncbi:NADH-quinone oxidoreductase subunit B family protein [Methanocella arvoryzae]|uniref:Coenzyme F420-non-reducing hydrogenase (Methyl viologen-reducing hydrogenase), gamma subunit n=1 Tax=Methanocella arvoryzae (strain DSM 22066 / NBRC 105507 / MRE50) TaxID=351160 RepID=Q0W6U0_METAR|nr:NADH ubiquinone oxidoreductase [Methanocella arvoryzae]CAJ35903.1 coenzyme F420-non-reducing hydrogenase (methyl viologen-reducing hydrogenase), gamma subunit [Methanocella arvoryzae MRE50]